MPSEMMPFIDLAAQQRVLKSEIDNRIAAVLAHGRYIMGPEVEELETTLQIRSGSRHCITCSSGTDALLMALMAYEIGPGDEVITTPFTFVSTVECIKRLGATCVYVDVQPDTCNIDETQLESKITAKTRAIIPVSLFGQPANMNQINNIARCNGEIPVIEDAAQSFGATYKTRQSGNLSTIGCTSFFPSKPLGCYGDGGAIFTNDDKIAQILREIRVHGQSKRYTHTRIGIGGRMDTIQCAIVLAKLKNFNWEVAQRQIVGKKYNTMLDAIGVKRVQQRDDRTSIFAQYTIFSNNRDKTRSLLQDKHIPTAVHYPIPLNEQTAYIEPDAAKNTPNAHRAAKEVLSLPMHPYLSDSDQEYIVETLHKISTK